MRKNGFTLAEVLITLGIIGVISALTLPTVTQDVTKQKVGPSLAKAVNTLENANTNLLKSTDTRSLYDACNNGTEEYNANSVETEYVSCLLNHSNIFGVQVPGTNYGEQDYNNCLMTKDGIAFCTGELGVSATDKSPKNYYGRAINIMIDINGPETKPNKIGKDAFSFLVDFYGTLIPNGGRQYNVFMGKATDAPLWETTCSGVSITDRMDCAGSIVDNNWKVIYNY